jgi:Chaperone of endosialidase
MNPLTQFKNATILPVLIALTLGCFGLLPAARAVCQEGCLTNNNTVLGEDALLSNTTGSGNTAIGFDALLNNTDGFNNTANGAFALSSNTTGPANTANGANALSSNTIGCCNTADGVNALSSNTSGGGNTASGLGSLVRNTTGDSNTANGANALSSNTTGLNNTASGNSALLSNTTGSNNIALGGGAGANLTTGDNNINIGNPGVAAESRTIRIGTNGTHRHTAIAGIRGTTVPSGIEVIVGSTGELGTVVSSARFKDDIKAMDKASEVILALKPVTFHYKHDLDPEGIPQFGLVAEEVEKVNPDLVARDEQGKPYTVRYEAVNAMLLNEFLKEHCKVEQLEATVAELKAAAARQGAINAQQQKGMEAFAAHVKEQDAKIQKVSDQLELRKPAPQVADNNAGGGD